MHLKDYNIFIQFCYTVILQFIPLQCLYQYTLYSVLNGIFLKYKAKIIGRLYSYNVYVTTFLTKFLQEFNKPQLSIGFLKFAILKYLNRYSYYTIMYLFNKQIKTKYYFQILKSSCFIVLSFMNINFYLLHFSAVI